MPRRTTLSTGLELRRCTAQRDLRGGGRHKRVNEATRHVDGWDVEDGYEPDLRWTGSEPVRRSHLRRNF